MSFLELTDSQNSVARIDAKVFTLISSSTSVIVSFETLSKEIKPVLNATAECEGRHRRVQKHFLDFSHNHDSDARSNRSSVSIKSSCIRINF